MSNQSNMSPEDYNNSGLDCALKGDLEKAIEDFTEAIQLNDKFVSAYRNRGTAYYDIGVDYYKNINVLSGKNYFQRGQICSDFQFRI